MLLMTFINSQKEEQWGGNLYNDLNDLSFFVV